MTSDDLQEEGCADQGETDEERILAYINGCPDGCSSIGISIGTEIKRSHAEFILEQLRKAGRINHTRNSKGLWTYYPASDPVPEPQPAAPVVAMEPKNDLPGDEAATWGRITDDKFKEAPEETEDQMPVQESGKWVPKSVTPKQCRYCGEGFDDGRKRRAHENQCLKNPNRSVRKASKKSRTHIESGRHAKCPNCGKEVNKSTMERHLVTCKPKEELAEAPVLKEDGGPDKATMVKEEGEKRKEGGEHNGERPEDEGGEHESEATEPKATHRCTICGCLWAFHPAGTIPGQPNDSWQMIGEGKTCCRDAAMGDQIEPLEVTPIGAPSPAVPVARVVETAPSIVHHDATPGDIGSDLSKMFKPRTEVSPLVAEALGLIKRIGSEAPTPEITAPITETTKTELAKLCDLALGLEAMIKKHGYRSAITIRQVGSEKINCQIMKA